MLDDALAPAAVELPAAVGVDAAAGLEEDASPVDEDRVAEEADVLATGA